MLRDCYGVPFPDEFFVIAATVVEQRAVPAIYTDRPWNLVTPLDRGGPPDANPTKQKFELRLEALDPDLVPLLALSSDRHTHGGAWICYQRNELADGRSTVVGVPRRFAEGAIPQPFGNSLTSVLVEHFADLARQLETQYEHPSNQGAGSVEEGEVANARRWLAQAEAIATSVAERKRPKLVP